MTLTAEFGRAAYPYGNDDKYKPPVKRRKILKFRIDYITAVGINGEEIMLMERKAA